MFGLQGFRGEGPRLGAEPRRTSKDITASSEPSEFLQNLQEGCWEVFGPSTCTCSQLLGSAVGALVSAAAGFSPERDLTRLSVN